MKIAQVSPLCEAVPPKAYGGTERVVAYLTDELVKLGHEVTLFASGESQTKAKLVNCRDQALRLDQCPLKSELASHLAQLDEVRRRANEFDIIHIHVDLLALPFFDDISGKTILTLHNRLDIPDLKGLFHRWPNYPLVSISDNQRTPLTEANWSDTIYHGLPLDLYCPPQRPTGGYLAFLGRLSPEKCPHLAIRIAQRVGRLLKIVAKVETLDLQYYREMIEPLLHDPFVEYLGEMGDSDKSDFLGNAEALLLPVSWPEPFGMVMIEAMACGTPVIAFNCGSVPEVIEHGVTGFIVNNEEEAVSALQRVHELDRQRIRAEFERRFSADVMASNYVTAYERLVKNPTHVVRPSVAQANEVSPTVIEPTQDAVPITVESDESRMPYKLFALKHADAFLVADSFGDVIGKGDGLFRDDTRVLSEFRLMLGDKPLSLLTAAVGQDNVMFTAHVTNRPLPPLGGRSIPEGVIHIKRTRFLWQERLYERLLFSNYGDEGLFAPLKFAFGADFKDMFEVRGMTRKARGELLSPEKGESSVTMRYRGLDEVTRNSTVAFSQTPSMLLDNCAEFNLKLGCSECVELYIEVGPEGAERPSRQRFRSAAAEARRHMRKRSHSGGRLHSAELIFSHWLEKSRADLALLTTELPTGPYPYAGIPWFSTPFGRDAIITALQMLWFDPAIGRGVLNFLAQNQAQSHSSFRDAALGKIMHETRKGEMNALKEIPFGLYYGGVDTTPLFVMLAGAYAERTGDLAFIEQIWPSLEAAMIWIEETGDSNGDGFLDYASAESTGLRNQGWKDSEDSVFYENGEFPKGPIALVEVQGYKFGALKAMAMLAKQRGNQEAAERWQEKAEVVREAVEKVFWMEDKNFYALALDGDGRVCRVRASNAGHLLFSGLPSPERAAKVSQQLLSSAFDSGWGIRTLATDERRYNPMSYHNGSVWPHDTALCAAGMARYGDRAGAAHILAELFGAAVHFGMRLPELFCGFQRFPGDSPIAYPVACLPQAWASGSVFMTLQACLGLTIDGWRKEIRIDHPQLPHGINHLVVKNVRLGESSVDLIFQRVRDRIAVFTSGTENSDVKVLTCV